MAIAEAKTHGVYYTPKEVARTLLRWVARQPRERLLDPACGDGQFLALCSGATGVEQNPAAAAEAHRRSPGSTIHVDDFFRWADGTAERFECAVGNPPFIRYQRFNGDIRERALALCRRLGVRFSALSASWAPFLVVAAHLLKPGGRMAFVVPAEIGHAPYAAPLVAFLAGSFQRLHLVAIRETIFPELSQDVWLLYAEGYGGSTESIDLTIWDRFRRTNHPPNPDVQIPLPEWRRWSCRLRPFILPPAVRRLYADLASGQTAMRFGDVARIGIGYVTGANDFFHLRPSVAESAGIPRQYLVPAVRNGRMLPPDAVTKATVREWLRRDEPCLLLRLNRGDVLPESVIRYLESESGRVARCSYKCRHRQPWHVVPDVRVPDGFLTYMSGSGPLLVSNAAGCVCTNSVHAVQTRNGMSFPELQRGLQHPLGLLSAEIEGHPLGGGLLKLEPGEAARVVLPKAGLQTSPQERQLLTDGLTTLRRWRHDE